MNTLDINEYLLIEKKDKTGAALSIKEIDSFDFSECSAKIEGKKIILEPENYSSTTILRISLSDEHLEILEKYQIVTIAQVGKNSKFSGIYEIPLQN